MAVLLLFVAAVDAVVERHVGAHAVVAAHGCAVERQVYAAEKIPCACKVADGEFGVRRIVVVGVELLAAGYAYRAVGQCGVGQVAEFYHQSEVLHLGGEYGVVYLYGSELLFSVDFYEVYGLRGLERLGNGGAVDVGESGAPCVRSWCR